MAIFYQNLEVPFPKIERKKTSLWIKSVIDRHKRTLGTLTYVFCSDAEVLNMNKRYLNHDYYTDIITFDYSEGDVLSGDLFISLDTVRSNSEKFKTDYDEELRRVMIHGLLHLCGYNDKDRKQIKTMREEENAALQIWHLTKQNNYDI